MNNKKTIVANDDREFLFSLYPAIAKDRMENWRRYKIYLSDTKNNAKLLFIVRKSKLNYNMFKGFILC